MDHRLHKRLLNDIEELRVLIARYSTETVVGMTSIRFQRSPGDYIGLLSPHKQLFYLLGLMVSTPEPADPQEFGNTQWDSVRGLLERVFDAYVQMYWPTAEEMARTSVQRDRARQIAMPAFLQYFTSGLLASTTQVKERIERYLVPLDAKVKARLGISASEMLRATDGLARILNRDFDSLAEAKKREEETRPEFFALAEEAGWDAQKLRERTRDCTHRTSFERLCNVLQRIFKIELCELQQEVGTELARTYWDLFTVWRGVQKEYTYLTEENKAEDQPIFLLEEEKAIVPSVHSVYIAILNRCEKELMESSYREGFLRHRDKTLENETAGILRRFFETDSTLLTSTYETPDRQFEHDTVVLWEGRVFVVEVKASPPVEPFRDPDKAACRILRAFASDRGIQKAYEQAHRIESALAQGRIVRLYDGHGEQVSELTPKAVSQVYTICVTRDNFGLLASDLSLLLQKDPVCPYPLAINILDLDAILDGWLYFGWGPDRLCEYLDGRQRMHGKVMAADELEFTGYFVESGSFAEIPTGDRCCSLLDPHYSDVFDRIFLARKGGDAVVCTPRPPVTTEVSPAPRELSKTSTRIYPFNQQRRTAVPKQGRNELCAGGSGKKYKRCCGR